MDLQDGTTMMMWWYQMLCREMENTFSKVGCS